MIWRKCIRCSKGSSRPSYIWNFGKTKCNGASWCKIAGANGDDDMSSYARSAGSRLLCGEGDLFDRGLLTGGWSRWGGGEKLFEDFDRARLRGTAGLLGQGVMAVLRKTTFSSRKATLVAKKEANCCWWDSCWSFSICSNDSSHCSNVGSELEGGISTIGLPRKGLWSSFQQYREAWD